MYQSLYRKYRPQTFMEIYGQDAISQTLTNAIVLNRVAHAYLFSGTRGTGKTSTAKLLAKALNCTNIVDGKICDECENCLMIKNNSHPDVVEIDAASNNGVDEVRDLIEKVKYAPIKGVKKVYIIDEVHMMSQGAFNALLKTLEEPPEHVVFILATTEQHKVLNTIKSRCQKFVFKKIKENDIVSCLKNILEKENCSYEEDALKIISTLCDGGMRDALSILEQVMIFSNNDISVSKVNEALDLVSHTKIEELYHLIYSKELEQALSFIDDLEKDSIDYQQVMSEIVKLALKELLVVKNNSKENDVSYLLNMIDKFDESLERLKFDNSKRLYLDLAIIKTINYQKTSMIPDINNIVNNTILNDTLTIDKTSQESSSINESDDQLEKEIVETIDSHFEEPVNDFEENIEYEIPVVDEDELMNVLVQATRDDLNYIKEKWSLIDDYLLNVNTKKEAGLLIESKPVAASEKAMIVVCSQNVEVSLINSARNILPIQRFINEFSKMPRFCFAISLDDWQELKDKYVKLRQLDNLPKAKQVLENVALNTIDVKEEKVKDEVLEIGKRIFKDKLTIRKED